MRSSFPSLLSQLPAPPPPPTPTAPFHEKPTSSKPHEQTIYQSLLSVFDEMTIEERLEFIELAFLFKDLTPEARKRILKETELAHG